MIERTKQPGEAQPEQQTNIHFPRSMPCTVQVAKAENGN